MLPVFKNNYFYISAKGFPHVPFTAELLATGLVKISGKFENLMKVKGQQG